jgi:hypothetical protein
VAPFYGGKLAQFYSVANTRLDHVISNPPFHEWTSVFASERLTGALLDRLPQDVHILGNECRQSWVEQGKSRPRADAQPADSAGT